MISTSQFIKGLCAAVVLSASSSATMAAVIFKDGFEKGNLSATVGAAKWDGAPDVTVSSTRVKSGSYAAKLHFAADVGRWSQLQFDLGGQYKEVWMTMALYVPSNYYHRVGGDGPNNKIYRLWGTDYGNIEKVGYSVWSAAGDNGASFLAGDWNGGAGLGPKGDSALFIGSADLGKWMTVKIYTKAATATTKGTIKIWKNGTLILSDTQVNNYTAGESHAYRYGYLIGNANSGFDQTTDFYIDDVVFATTEADLGGSTSATVSPPSAPSLNVQAQ